MIEFRNVTKIYPSGDVAVSPFSYCIPPHRTVALVGSSGSGKTTLLRMINRMVEPTSGQILIDGKDVREHNAVSLRRSIGYVMQSGGLLPHRTVLQNIATVLRLNKTPKQQAYDRAQACMEQVGLDPSLAPRYPSQLSGGQQQRVGVARALAAEPNILLMDEPFGALDPIVRQELQDELRSLQRELGKTILFVTHDIDEAFYLGDEVVILKQGAVIAQHGTPERILSNPTDAFVRKFIGADRPERILNIEASDKGHVARDHTGRIVGVITS